MRILIFHELQHAHDRTQALYVPTASTSVLESFPTYNTWFPGQFSMHTHGIHQKCNFNTFIPVYRQNTSSEDTTQALYLSTASTNVLECFATYNTLFASQFSMHILRILQNIDFATFDLTSSLRPTHMTET